MSCPEENTCPIIDEVEDHLDKIEVITLDMIVMLSEDTRNKALVDAALFIVDSVRKANPIMDDIRIANAAIRSWGEEQEDKALLNKKDADTLRAMIGE